MRGNDGTRYLDSCPDGGEDARVADGEDVAAIDHRAAGDVADLRQRARAAGATVVEEPAVHDYGVNHWADRSYGALDPEGHLWWFTERVRNAPGE